MSQESRNSVYRERIRKNLYMQQESVKPNTERKEAFEEGAGGYLVHKCMTIQYY